MTDAANRTAKTYSGGMRRRLDLAASLVNRPPVLFLDEPTTGLDPASRTDLWGVIEALVAGGTTVLLTTQYLEEADRLADRIMVIDCGRTIAEGTPAELKQHYGATVVEITLAPDDVARAEPLLAPLGKTELHRSRDARRDHRRRRARDTRGGADARPGVPHTGTPHGPRTEPRRRVPLPDRAPSGRERDERDSTPRRRTRCGMTAITASSDRAHSLPAGVPSPAADRVTPKVAVADGIAVAWRNLLSMLRTPEVLVFSSIQPIIFVLMFRFVFGGAITVPGESYVNFLMPGIFIQTVAFGSVTTAIGMATDLQGGVIDRFRSLPMARSAVLAGRTIADLVRSVWVVILMAVVGTLVGFRVQTNGFAALAAVGIILLFAFALSWVFAYFGLVTANPEAAQAASFPFLAIFVFASSAFVPLDTMPGWLQAFAEHQPVTAAINAVRALVLGGPTASYVVRAVAWCIGIVVIFAPLAVHRYRRSA